MKTEYKVSLVLLGVFIIISSQIPEEDERGVRNNYQERVNKDKQNFYQQNSDMIPDAPEDAVGWDYEKSRWVIKRNGTFNNAEVQEIRRNLDTDEYLYTPGRARGYQSFDEQVEEYLEDNPELLEEWQR